MKKFAVAVMAALGVGAAGATVVVDFEGIAGASSFTTYNSQSFTDSGFTFFLDHGHVLDSAYGVGSYAANNGTDWLMHDAGGQMVVTKSGGGAFTLSSLDYSSYHSSGSGAVTVTGTHSDSSLVLQVLNFAPGFQTQSFSSGWSDLVSVSFSGWSGQAYDNFVFDYAPSAQVPVPSALALVGLGLFGLGVSRRRAV